MTNLRTSLFALGSCVLLTAPASFTLAQDAPVVVVIRVDTHGKSTEYLESLKPLLERGRELNPEARTRVSEATQAGEDTGAILIATRYSSLKEMAASQGLVADDKEWTKRMEALSGTGRTIVSRSLLVDCTPSSLGDQAPIEGPSTVAEVTTVELGGTLQDYIKALEPLFARAKEIGGKSEIRVLQATLAGEHTGRVFVVVRRPSLEDWARGNNVTADQQFQKHLADVAATGRVVISRALLVDRTP